MRSSSPSTKPRRSAASASGVPLSEGDLGAIADAIDQRRGPAAPPAGEPQPVGGEHLADAVARQVAGLPGLGLAQACRWRSPARPIGRSGTGSGASTARRPSAVWIRTLTSPRDRRGTAVTNPRAVAGRPVGPWKAPPSIAARRSAPTARPAAAAASASSASQAPRAARRSPRAGGDKAERPRPARARAPAGEARGSGGDRRRQRQPGGRAAEHGEAPARSRRADQASDASGSPRAGAGRGGRPWSPGRCRRSGRAGRPRRCRRADRGTR